MVSNLLKFTKTLRVSFFHQISLSHKERMLMSSENEIQAIFSSSFSQVLEATITTCCCLDVFHVIR